MEHNRLAAALILLYTGIDTMAWLNRPIGKDNVSQTDFVDWANRYIRFPNNNQPSGSELYGARCAMLHGYTTISDMSRKKKVRMLGMVDQIRGDVVFDPKLHDDFAVVSLKTLTESFFSGIDEFLIDVHKDAARAKTFAERTQWLMRSYPAPVVPQSNSPYFAPNNR